MYAAEGSDWFWWFGEGHSSNQDDIFDQLFREHLASIYQALDEPIPPELNQPLEDHSARRDHQPEGFIHPVIDGIGDEQDWDRAGRLEIGGARGTMHRSSPIQRLFYGWDHLNFYLRLDWKHGIQPTQDLPTELHLLWFYPGIATHNSPVPLESLPDQVPLNYLFHHHLGIHLLTESIWLEEAQAYDQWHSRMTRAEARVNQCLEVAVPWADLHIEPDFSLALTVLFAEAGEFRDSLLEQELILLKVP